VSLRTLVIVNPRSRNGATGRRWERVRRQLCGALGTFDVEHTRGPRDAGRIAREAVRAGAERIVVAGGDGTLSEVVSGLLAAGLGDRAEIGLLPLGTGGDFARTLGLPRDLNAAIACIAAGKPRRTDAGRVRYLDEDSREATAYFVNVTSLGISGLTVQLVNRTTKVFGGALSFLVGTLRSIARYRCQDVSVRVDGRLVHQGPLILATAANGRYFGGGMQVAPEARTDDGLLDVIAISQLSKPQLLAKLPLIYAGGHLQEPAVSSCRGRVVEVEASPGTVYLDVDGEPLGTLPARIEVLPAAISLLGPPS
jgi:YegS/Rv2252/BmrU family lipid kinase